MQNARLGFLIPMLGAGGAERVTIEIATGLVSDLGKIDIITNETVGEFVANVNSDIGLYSTNSYNFFRVIWRIKKYYDAERPNIIFAQGTRMSIHSVVALALSRHQPKIVWCMHNPYETKQRLYPKPIASILTWGVKNFARVPVRIIGVSEGVCNSFLNYCGKKFASKTIVLHNPIPAYEGPLFDRIYPAEKGNIIAVGRLEHQKNFSLLIDSINIVKNKMNVSVKIYGQGPLRDELEGKINKLKLNDYIHLAGYSSDVRQRIAESDLFVLCSSWEGLPTVLIEAMSTGVPIVSTDCKYGPFEILEGGRWGELVPEDDEVALADAIVKILSGGGIDARAQAQKFLPEVILARYKELISEIISEKF